MPRKVRPIGHEDRLSVVDHLDELRSRLFVCLGVLFLAFCVCFWQNGHLINLLNNALPAAAKSGLGSQGKQDASVHHAMHKWALASKQLERTDTGTSPLALAVHRYAGQSAKYAEEASKALQKTAASQEKPITIGVGESFTTTIMVVGYFALLLTLPLLLYQLYAFVIPALSREERGAALPAMVAAPVLFLTGAIFTYFEILPPAVHFLQGYNSNKFQILVQASSYYKFEILLMLGIGLAFQVPLLLLALQKVGIITARTLTVNWRYAVVIIAVIAAALPGVDPVTMAFETAPLVLLYLASIVMLNVVERRSAKRAAEAERDRVSEHV